MSRTRLPAVLLALIAVPLVAQDDKKKSDTKDATALTLENLFPKRGLFGPRASAPAFSKSGKFAVWLHKDHAEARHGNDLFLLDVRKGKTTRLTNAKVMAEYQHKARKVVEERKKKWAKKGDGETENDGTFVGEKDVDDEKAPRYGGISGFEWAPQADEFLFWSDGDVYRFTVGDMSIHRLTRTDERESDVAYLHDGKGYTYLRDDRLYCVRFGSHVLEQLDPEFESGETLTGYEISPDGKRAAFLTRHGSGRRDPDRKVKIARYRDRFMEVREVPRQVSDDPIKPTRLTVWLYDLGGTMAENGPVYRVHVHEVTGPRDVLRSIEWSPDSSRVAFASFTQKSGHVEVFESRFPSGDEPAPPAPEAKDADKTDEDSKENDEKPKSTRIRKHPARVVHRFLHDGGPNTPRMINPQYLADSHHLVFLSEQSGFRHLHVLDPLYQSLRQLTWGHFEVYPFDLSEKRDAVYATATREHPSRVDIYRIDIESGKMHRLTSEVGTYDGAAISPDGQHVLANFAAFASPRELVHVQPKHNKQKKLTDSHPKVAHAFTKATPELFEYANRHGHKIHGNVFKPDGWKKSDHRPLLIYVYGGPLGTRKQITQGNFHYDGYFFAYYMAKTHGFVTATIDPRGMSGYGAMFEKANFEQVGKPQVEDLVDGVEHLIANHGADPSRVGIHGWSFGGFQTQMCMYTEPDVFQVGIAGAGPTEWENYNSWYSTGTIGDSRVGKPDLEKYSLLPLAKNLEGRLMLVHGMEDSNVLYQDTVRVYRELLKAGKETLVELFLDPTGGHSLGGDVKRVNRARKYEEFLVRNLGGRSTPPKDLLTQTPKPKKDSRTKTKPGKN